MTNGCNHCVDLMWFQHLMKHKELKYDFSTGEINYLLFWVNDSIPDQAIVNTTKLVHLEAMAFWEGADITLCVDNGKAVDVI